MATKIITKNSSTATSIPTAGDLVQGELAVNVTDKRLFTEDSGGAIVELGTNPSTLTSGTGTFSGSIALNTASTASTISMARNNTGNNNMTKYSTGGTDEWIVGQRNDGTSNFRFYNYATASDVVSIDTSGNLLVGTTDDNVTNNSGNNPGINIGVAGIKGFIAAARYQQPPLSINRLGNDGDIQLFSKDGTTVGSIGTENSHIYMTGSGATSAGLRLQSNNIITPMTNGSLSDNTVDLGYSTNRFKDLYLSGGVYLGGTGAANKLDDYEKGTWTPTIGASTANPTMTYNTQSAVYTKVGNLVSVTCKIITATRSGGSGQLTVDGLPFTVAANVDSPIYIGFNYNWTTPPNGGSCQGGTNHVLLYSSIENNVSSGSADIVASGNSYLIFSATYITA